jgi:hypothetical protein
MKHFIKLTLFIISIFCTQLLLGQNNYGYKKGDKALERLLQRKFSLLKFPKDTVRIYNTTALTFFDSTGNIEKIHFSSKTDTLLKQGIEKIIASTKNNWDVEKNKNKIIAIPFVAVKVFGPMGEISSFNRTSVNKDSIPFAGINYEKAEIIKMKPIITTIF